MWRALVDGHQCQQVMAPKLVATSYRGDELLPLTKRMQRTQDMIILSVYIIGYMSWLFAYICINLPPLSFHLRHQFVSSWRRRFSFDTTIVPSRNSKGTRQPTDTHTHTHTRQTVPVEPCTVCRQRGPFFSELAARQLATQSIMQCINMYVYQYLITCIHKRAIMYRPSPQK